MRTPGVIIYLCIMLIFVSCSNHEKTKIQEINPTKFEKTELFLSEYAESIDYIQLESNPPFSSIITCKVVDSLIYAAVRPNGNMLVYDMKGKFQRKIGRNGRGPGEYKYAMHFCVDSDEGKVYVLSQKKIIIYSIGGSFIKEISLADYDTTFCSIRVHHGNIYLFDNFCCGYMKYNWLVLNKEGEQVSSKLNSVAPFKCRQIPGNKIVFEDDENMYYWNYLNDSIFQIKPDNHSLKYLFAHGNFRISPSNWDNDKIVYGSCFRPDRIFKTHNSLILRYFMAHRYGIAVSKTRNLSFKSYEIDFSEKIFGFINDIDGGMPLDPKQCVNSTDKQYLMSYIPALSLKQYVESNKFGQTKCKQPVLHEKLKAFASQIDENDNPILILAKLKE
ncbi:6-bladed beta-propeller [Puteibacter caeruleilacunae]|nr:6-bladed beta-propeller [Puteibacter caeruleilacunae]